MSPRGPKVTIYDRVEEFKSEGLNVCDAKNKDVMCQYCTVRIAWDKKSTVDNHCKSQTHGKNKEAKILKRLGNVKRLCQTPSTEQNGPKTK